MKRFTAVISVALLTGCSGMSMHNQSGSSMAMAGGAGGPGSNNFNSWTGRYDNVQWLPNKNPHDLTNNIYFGG